MKKYFTKEKLFLAVCVAGLIIILVNKLTGTRQILAGPHYDEPRFINGDTLTQGEEKFVVTDADYLNNYDKKLDSQKPPAKQILFY